MSLSNNQYSRTFGGASGGAFPRFFLDDVQDEIASAEQGRPIFRSLERVEIILPGNAYNRPVKNVTDEHRQQWPDQYKAFKAGHEMAVTGTPLEQWPILNRSMVLELKALELHTVEQVAEMSDTAVQMVGRGGYNLRERAKGYLDEAAQAAFSETLNRNNELLLSENAAMKNQIAAMGEQMQGMQAALTQLQNAPNALATSIPSMVDPMERANQAAPMAAPSASSLDMLAEPKRRPGRPARAA